MASVQCHHVAHLMMAPCEVDDSAPFYESNLMHSINAKVYGSQYKTLSTVQGELVRWYVFGLGNEVDLHTPHWHGNSLVWKNRRVDEIEMMPASMFVVDMVPDNVGRWFYHCHVNDHILAGMITYYTVAKCNKYCGNKARQLDNDRTNHFRSLTTDEIGKLREVIGEYHDMKMLTVIAVISAAINIILLCLFCFRSTSPSEPRKETEMGVYNKMYD